MASTLDKTYLFEEMPIKSAVLRQIVPSICSQMVVLLYNLADTFFVGMLNDPVQTAAVTIAYPVTVMLIAIANLFAIGGASVLAHALGQKDFEKAKSVASIAFWCGLGSAVLFSLLFIVLETPILSLCGATDATYEAAFQYAKWVVVAGGVGSILNIVLANLVRADGSALVAAFGVSFGGVVNIILDPFFVLPQFLGLQVEGAGIATAISNILVAVFFLVYLYIKRKDTVIIITPNRLKNIKKYIKNIVSIGVPSAIQYALTVVGVAALAKFVSGYGAETVAGLGIVKKLDQLPLSFAIGVANGLLPILAYNFASGNNKRRHSAFMFGLAISCGFALLCVICYEIFAPFLVGIFINDPTTIEYSSKFLRIMVVAMPMMALCYPMITQFQTMGRVKESLVCSVLRKGSLDIPLLFIMNSLIPLYGCMMVQPIVDSISLAVAVYYYRKVRKEESLFQLKG